MFAFFINIWEDSLFNLSVKTLSSALPSAREKIFLSLSIPLYIIIIIILMIKHSIFFNNVASFLIKNIIFTNILTRATHEKTYILYFS
jgi:hypothetical protein